MKKIVFTLGMLFCLVLCGCGGGTTEAQIEAARKANEAMTSALESCNELSDKGKEQLDDLCVFIIQTIYVTDRQQNIDVVAELTSAADETVSPDVYTLPILGHEVYGTEYMYQRSVSRDQLKTALLNSMSMSTVVDENCEFSNIILSWDLTDGRGDWKSDCWLVDLGADGTWDFAAASDVLFGEVSVVDGVVEYSRFVQPIDMSDWEIISCKAVEKNWES